MANEVRLHRVQYYFAGVRQASAPRTRVDLRSTDIALLRALSAQPATNSAARPANVIGFSRYFCAVFLSYACVHMPERDQKTKLCVRTCIACIMDQDIFIATISCLHLFWINTTLLNYYLMMNSDMHANVHACVTLLRQ